MDVVTPGHLTVSSFQGCMNGSTSYPSLWSIEGRFHHLMHNDPNLVWHCPCIGTSKPLSVCVEPIICRISVYFHLHYQHNTDCGWCNTNLTWKLRTHLLFVVTSKALTVITCLSSVPVTGRLAPGLCSPLWKAHTHIAMVQYDRASYSQAGFLQSLVTLRCISPSCKLDFDEVHWLYFLNAFRAISHGI